MKMKAWSVSEVAGFLRGVDLEGPAAALHASGVNGDDLLHVTSVILRDDIKLTPFAARKVMSARDEYLSGL